MLYRYLAYTTAEGIVKGTLEAPTEFEARSLVHRLGYRRLKIFPARRLPSADELFPSLFKVTTGELIRFSRQMATILSSGGNLLTTLEMLKSESRNRMMRKTLTALAQALDSGKSLSQALEEHPRVFNHLFVSVVEVGEYTGALAPALEHLAEMLEKAHEAKQQAIRTMMYPMAIMTLSFLTLGVLMTVALPPLLEVFDSLGSDIPLMTKIAINGMAAARANMANMAIGMVLAAVAFVMLRKIPSVKLWMDTKQASMPVLGSVIVSSELARFSRTTAILLDAGVGLSPALKLGISGISNGYIRCAFLDAEEALLNGERLASALFRYPVIPTIFSELVMIGEESNSLPRTMSDAARTYEGILDQRINTMVSMLEPVSTIAVGGIVGFIAFAMFVPIYSGLDGLE